MYLKKRGRETGENYKIQECDALEIQSARRKTISLLFRSSLARYLDIFALSQFYSFRCRKYWSHELSVICREQTHGCNAIESIKTRNEHLPWTRVHRSFSPSLSPPPLSLLLFRKRKRGKSSVTWIYVSMEVESSTRLFSRSCIAYTPLRPEIMTFGITVKRYSLIRNNDVIVLLCIRAWSSWTTGCSVIFAKGRSGMREVTDEALSLLNKSTWQKISTHA